MKSKIDWFITIVPIGIISLVSLLFFIFPVASNSVLSQLRFFFGDTLGVFYIILGLAIFSISLYLCFSHYGNIVLGKPDEKPKYSFFTWGSMMFTCGLAADILFYSFSEWIMYARTPHLVAIGSLQEWAGVFPLFHWSFIPWSFYLVLAVSFGFMLHVRSRNKQSLSEACRPILGSYTDIFWGRLIDLIAVFALLAGTATTFSVATPLMSIILQNFFNITISRTVITIIIILITCVVYTYFLLSGFKGIAILSKLCIYLFFSLILFIFTFGGQSRYIVETGIESFGRMLQNFISLSTYIDPLRETNFAQDWTIYYWAYWMVWCVAAPFFIGNISKGRTVRQVIAGGYLFGVGSTMVSFIVFGNYSLGLQTSGIVDFVGKYARVGDLYGTIISVIETLPMSPVFLIGLLITMVTFYATSFDSIAYTVACYSYKELTNDESPHKIIQLLWCILLILLPITLVFSESSMKNIQTVSIIAAFPIGIIIFIIIVGFFKDATDYISEIKNNN